MTAIYLREHSDRNPGGHVGKGAAARRGIAVSRGAEVLVVDADLAIPLWEYPGFSRLLAEGAGVVIASKELGRRAGTVSQPRLRVLMGRVFNLAVRMLVLPGVTDSQAGFKLFGGKLARKIVGESVVDGFAFDVELLALVRHSGAVTVNGREVPNVPALWDWLEREVERLAENVEGSVVHGDLCLSNILYDLRSRVCKLVDPRGSFGKAGIYGDPRYDVAKLYHSIYGLYDFITNDLFHVAIDGGRVNLEIRSRPQHEQIRQRFEKVFFGQFDRREILLITGLLFASMPALHYDAPRRQIAMYARALELLGEAYAPARAKQKV